VVLDEQGNVMEHLFRLHLRGRLGSGAQRSWRCKQQGDENQERVFHVYSRIM
jgi:hypothetical protein